MVGSPELAAMSDKAPTPEVATAPVLAWAAEVAAEVPTPPKLEAAPVLVARLVSRTAPEVVGPSGIAPGCGLSVIPRPAARVSSSVGGSPYLSAKQASRDVVSGPMGKQPTLYRAL